MVREMNIAVVDDKSKGREEVIQHIMKYKRLNHLDFHILEYESGTDLLKDIDSKSIEVVFLDIYMDVLGI